MERRSIHQRTNPESLQKFKEKLNSGQNFVDYFFTVGLDPEISLQSWLYEASINELNSTYKEQLSPKIINKFPSFKKKLIDIEDPIISYIFPLGFQIIEALNEPPKEKLYSLLLDNNTFSIVYPNKYVTCLLFYEPLIKYRIIYDKYNDTNMAISTLNNSRITNKKLSNNTFLNVSMNIDNNIDNNSNELFIMNGDISSISSIHNNISMVNNINDITNIHPVFKGSNIPISELSQRETKFSSILKSYNTYNHNITINQNYKHLEKYYVPKCICLVSLYPFINDYKEILLELYKYSKLENVEIPLEKIINNLVLEVPIPPRGLYTLEYTFLERKLLLKNSRINSLFHVNFEFEILFMKFDVSQILAIIQYLLFGVMTVFFSSEIQYLTPIILSSLVLLFPFKYPFPIVSVLSKDSYYLLDNPTPQILGINEKYYPGFFKQNDIYINDKLLVVDIDEQNLIQLSDNNPKKQSKIPSFPKNLTNELSKKLKNYLSRNFNNKKDSSFEITIRNFFLEFQAQLLINYPKYLNSNIYEHPSEDAFNEKAFLKSVNKSDYDFYKTFIETQMFKDYIAKRMTPSDKDKKEMSEVLFFEEKILEMKGEKDKIIYINSNIFNFTNKTSKVPEVNKDLNENILEYYLNESNQKKLLLDGIIINNISNLYLNETSFLHSQNNSFIEKKSLSFNYILFPKLNNDFFFENETKQYFLNLQLNDDIKKLNARLISKSYLNRVEIQTKEINNYIYLLWLKVWANSFHYHDKKEHKYRYLQMMKVFEKINQHDMSVLSHLFQSLIKSEANEDLIYHLYIKIIQSKLSPTLEIFDTVKNMISKKLNRSGMPSSIEISKFLSNKTKIEFTKDEVNKKNFRERTMKNIYDYYTITEKISIVMDETCGNCQKNINFDNFQKNLNKINDDIIWAKCPFCDTNYFPKIKIIFGSELNKNDKLKSNTSLVDEVALYSPETLQTNVLDYSNIDIDTFKLNNNSIFWNLIWYFKLSGLPYDFILPYTENIFRPKKNNNHNSFKVNFSKSDDFIDINKKEKDDGNNGQIKINNISEINNNFAKKIPNTIVQKTNIVNNNKYNTIVNKINNNGNKNIPANNIIIKLPPKINNNTPINNYNNINPNLSRVNTRQIRPVKANIKLKQNNYIIYNKGYKVLNPINNYSSLRIINPQIAVPASSLNNYNYYNTLNNVGIKNNPNYRTNYNVINNSMNNNRIIYNNNNYLVNQHKRLIIPRQTFYPVYFTYNKFH